RTLTCLRSTPLAPSCRPSFPPRRSSDLLVPDSAVLRSGEKNTVFVALDGGKFEPRTITLGPRSEEDLYQVLAGLNEGERVVTSRSEEHTSELQSPDHLVCRLLLEKKKQI